MSHRDELAQSLASAPREILFHAHGPGRSYPLGGSYDGPQAHLKVFL